MPKKYLVGNDKFGKKIHLNLHHCVPKVRSCWPSCQKKKRANKERTGKWDIRELEIISQRGETWNNRIKSKKNKGEKYCSTVVK